MSIVTILTNTVLFLQSSSSIQTHCYKHTAQLTEDDRLVQYEGLHSRFSDIRWQGLSLLGKGFQKSPAGHRGRTHPLGCKGHSPQGLRCGIHPRSCTVSAASHAVLTPILYTYVLITQFVFTRAISPQNWMKESCNPACPGPHAVC